MSSSAGSTSSGGQPDSAERIRKLEGELKELVQKHKDLKSSHDELAAAHRKLEASQATLQRQADAWLDLAAAENGDRLLQVRIALLDDANGWAQHFSTVRLGVTTFLLLVALGIMQFRWDDPTPFVVTAACLSWALAIALFTYFTFQEYRKLRQVQVNKNKLLAMTGTNATERTWKGDVAMYCLGVFTVAFLIAVFGFWKADDAGEPTGSENPAAAVSEPDNQQETGSNPATQPPSPAMPTGPPAPAGG